MGDAFDVLHRNGGQFLLKQSQGVLAGIENPYPGPGIQDTAHGQDGQVGPESGPAEPQFRAMTSPPQDLPGARFRRFSVVFHSEEWGSSPFQRILIPL